MNYKLLLYIAITAFSLHGCSDSKETKGSQSGQPVVAVEDGTEIELRYAEGFRIQEYEDYTLLEVFNPWKGAEQSFSYALIEDGVDESQFADDVIILHAPLERTVSYSTTHLGAFDMLDIEDKLVGVANAQWVYSEEINKLIDAGEITAAGSDADLDYERLVSLEPDVVLTYGIDGGFLTNYQKMQELDLDVVVIAEYMEDTPLGQAEWIKFIGALYGKLDEATELFNGVADEYEKTRDMPEKYLKSFIPTVFCNLPWKGVWYMPAGRSFTAQYIHDAGGNYLWHDSDEDGSLSLDFEVVYEKAANADVWLQPGGAASLDDIAQMDPRLKDFRAWQSGEVYNNNKRLTEAGGNDLWESGIYRPDWVLKDIVKVLHPDLLPEHEFVYTEKLK